MTGPAVTRLRATTYIVPTTTTGTPLPESDGTASWDSTGVLVVEATAGGRTGLGYSYGSPAALAVVRDILAPAVVGSDAFATTRTFWRMARSVRNIGWAGVAAGALSAVDIALHDLRARLLDVSLVDLLGAARDGIAAYGSGGFTNYDARRLADQLSSWRERGMRAVKMKIGSDPAADPERVRIARAAIGDDMDLFVDANGAYERAQALMLAKRFAEEAGVTWFEEPVSSDDLAGLRLARDRVPAGMRVAAGEYAYRPADFRALLAADAVDVLQADATRCGGVTGFLGAAAQCTAVGLPLSAHTAPALHAVLGCVAEPVVNVESFHDHELIESMLFDGVSPLVEGCLTPDRARPGHGLMLTDRGEDHVRERWETP